MSDGLTRTYSIAQAASELGVSRRTIYNYLSAGLLKTMRTAGGSQRVLGPSLEARRGTRGAHTRGLIAPESS